MRRGGLFAILLAAMVATGCGSTMYSESLTSDSAAPESLQRAAAGVATSADYAAAEDIAASYDYDNGAEAVADVYDESTLEEIDPSYNVAAKDDDSEDTANSGVDDAIAEVDTSKKVIRNMTYSVETTDLDALDQAIQAKVTELGGYIESSSRDGSAVYDDGYYLGDDGNTYYDTSYASRSGKRHQYRYAYYSIRIPARSLDQFAEAVETGANVLSQSTTTQDITSSYVDTDSRRKSLEEELQILNNMAADAETVDELIQIESQRSDVRYELENIKSQLQSMDDRVAYSTVSMDVTEVTVLTDTTTRDLTWQERIGNGFTNSCERLMTTSQEIAIWFASNVPMIVFWIVVVVIALVILRLALRIICAILGIKRGKKTNKSQKSAGENETVGEDQTAEETHSSRVHREAEDDQKETEQNALRDSEAPAADEADGDDHAAAEDCEE